MPYRPDTARAINEVHAYERFAAHLMEPIAAYFKAAPVLDPLPDSDPEPLFPPVDAVDCYCAALRLHDDIDAAAHARWMALMTRSR